MAAGIWVENVAWPEVEQRLTGGALAILPVGAAAKEHGRHLPMNTDFRQAEWIAGRIAEHDNVVVWPVLSYGYYPVFADYPGSITLSADTFERVVNDILAGIRRAGSRRMVVLNTGISTIAPLERAAEAFDSEHSVHLVNVYSGPRFARTVDEFQEQAWGGHADELETSIMLAIAGDMVSMVDAEAAPVRIERGLFNRCDPDAPNYSPSGVNGDPRLASTAKGEALVSALLADVRAAIAGFIGT